MDTNALFQTLNSIAIISPPLREAITGCILEERFTKKSILLKEGQVAQRIYFIKHGFVRAYYEKQEGTFTNWFNRTGDIIISVYSFYSRNPSFEYIETLDDCVLQSITWDQLQKLYHHFPEFNAVGRIITEQYYIRTEKKSIDLQTLGAQQRYEQLLAEYPGILQIASLGQIATYLSIKQETLSRIRAKK